MFTLRTSVGIFEHLLDIVVRGGVFSESERGRDTRPLTDVERRRIGKGGHDFRPPKLVRISGKGGYTGTVADDRRMRFRNVTLLDHTVSVTRGALVFAEIDLRASGVAEDDLSRRLAGVAATAFLHDADKMLEKSRLDELDASDIAALVARYRVDAFLREYAVPMTPSALLQRIDAVEVTRVDRLVPGGRLLSQDEINDCAYVRLADRLDGAFLHEDEGVAGVVGRLNEFAGLRTNALGCDWRHATVSSPHTPFLLDSLQAAFSGAVRQRSGMPPLIETHHDGILLLVAPESIFDAALDDAIDKIGSVLKTGLRVDVNERGTRDLLDGGSSFEDLVCALEADARTAEKALFLHVDVLAAERDALESTFDLQGFGPRLDELDRFNGKHFSCWPSAKDEPPHIAETRVLGAAFAVALSCAPPKDRRLADRIPDAGARERELTAALDEAGAPAPHWIPKIGHALSRYTLLAAYAACASRDDDGLHRRLTGEGGVVRIWLEGDGNGRPGLLEKVGDPGGKLARAAGDWMRAAAARTFVAQDETDTAGRCHFTAAPVDASARIDKRSGLYGLKVSAFSGREGRPEPHDRIEAATLVSAPAAAEHRLRTEMAGRAGKDIPVLVSSPTSAGLFASLTLSGTPSLHRYSLYDLVRTKEKPGQRIYIDMDHHESRVALGRYDALPRRMTEPGATPGLISFVKIAVDSAIRTGRAIHVFRGLPVPTNAFVAFDFLPRYFAEAIGGAELRLEQLPRASETLGQIERIAETTGLGLDVALRVLDPATRFGAACEALVMVARLDEDTRKTLVPLRSFLLDIARDPTMQTNPHDSVVVAFARAMARVQAAPRPGASNNERDLGMRVALAQTDDAGRIGQTARESLIAAIATGLENEFERSSRLEFRGKTYGRPFPRRRAAEAAEIFVDRVWEHAFRRRAPAGRERRVALAIYRAAFETASYTKHEEDDGNGGPSA